MTETLLDFEKPNLRSIVSLFRKKSDTRKSDTL
jgi:hypothetical protein